MAFKEVVAAGVYLVREALRSPNFKTGVSGWTINRDGSAEFNNVVVRGTVTASTFTSTNYVAGVSGFKLDGTTGTVEFNSPVNINGTVTVKGDIQSNNYVANTTGYKLFGTTGTAEFNGNVNLNTNGVITGGRFQTDAPPNNRIAIYAASGSSNIQFYSGDPSEAFPAYIHAEDGLQTLIISGADYGVTPPSISMFSDSIGQDSFFVGANPFAANKAPFEFGSEIAVRIDNNSDVSLSSTNHGFQIGPDGGSNLRMDINEIQSANAGSADDLFIQNDGGDAVFGNNTNMSINVPGMVGARDSDTTTRTVAADFPQVLAGQVNVTVRRPRSGRLLICVNAQVFNATSATTQNYVGFEVRDTNSAGTVRLAGSVFRAGVASGAQDQTAAFTYFSDVLAGTSTNLWVGIIVGREAGGAGTMSVVSQSLSVIPML